MSQLALGSSMADKKAAGQLAIPGAAVTPMEVPEEFKKRAHAQYVYVPQGDVLDQYITSTAQRTFIMGPLGSGKTNASCWKGFRLCVNQEPDAQGIRRTRGVCVRNTYPDLFSTTIKDWLDMFEGLGRFKQGGKEPPTHFLKFDLPDGTKVDAEIVFLALDREEHVKKLRGLQATWAWINEAKELPFSIVSMLDLRVGRYPKDVRPTWYGIFGDTNAPDNDSWYFRLAEEMRPEGWKFLRQPGGIVRQSPDHPWRPNEQAENVHNLPRDYYKNGAQGKQQNWVLVNLANEYGFVGDGRPIWPDYVDSTHCKVFELVPGLPLHIGLDFGLTPAAVIGQQMPSGQVRWRYEIVTTDTGVGRFARILKDFLAEKCRGFSIATITGDPAGDQRQPGDNEERTVFQLLAVEGVIALPAPFNNDFTIRTEAVAKPLRTMIDGVAAVVIHPDMRVTRKGMQGAYKFRKLLVAGEDRYEEKPVKNAYSHPCEALQYGHLGMGFGHAVITPKRDDQDQVVAAFRATVGHDAQGAADAARFRARQRGIRR